MAYINYFSVLLESYFLAFLLSAKVPAGDEL